MNLSVKTDLWQYLSQTDKPILLYGMGNGADKILRVCESYGIEISDFFASDGFVRGHSFHSKVVLSYSEAKEKYGHFIVLLSFASALPDVLANIRRIAAENELYAPDVPVFGDNLFNLDFFRTHEKELGETYSLLADDLSRKTFINVIQYKLTGNISYLDACEADEEAVMRELIVPEEITEYADLGAYNGDTVRRLSSLAPKLRRVIAFEPDRRNFRKLSEYAEGVSESLSVTPLQLAAWSHRETLLMDASGNRNANLADAAKAKKTVEVMADSLDNQLGDLRPDYVKYDVEGSEKEAILGSKKTIQSYRPKLLVSLYHRSEDLFALPLLLKELTPDYDFYLRKLPYIPAWDLNLYAIPKENCNHV